jgi:hypothetical protein
MLVVLILLATLVVLLGGNDTSSHKFVLQATKPGFVDTGVVLRGGDRVTIEATGTINDDPAHPENQWGPEGTPRGDPDQASGDPRLDFPHAALIGRVGDGDPFLVGRRFISESSPAGPLWLRINDGRADDNSGSFDVSIDVHRQ